MRARAWLSTAPVSLAVAAALLTAAPARAVDGVVEINAACVAVGCFGGDKPGWPVTLDGSAGKSYRLTSDLELPDGNATGIFITGAGASGLTIDLNGFTIGCFPGICATGTGRGIDADVGAGIPPTTIRVRNGTVQGVGEAGIRLGILSVVEDVTVLANRGRGISLGPDATVTRVRAIANGDDGIGVGDGSRVVDTTASSNGDDGISVASHSVVEGCVARQNEGNGVRATWSLRLSGSVLDENGVYGVTTNGKAHITGNVVRENDARGISTFESVVTGNTASGNGTSGAGSGIWCWDDCHVRENLVVDNASDGLALGNGSVYADNVAHGNGTGGVSGGINGGGNSCMGTGVALPSCP